MFYKTLDNSLQTVDLHRRYDEKKTQDTIQIVGNTVVTEVYPVLIHIYILH